MNALRSLSKMALLAATLSPFALANTQFFCLKEGEKLASASGMYSLDMQNDGNLVLYSDLGAIWATDTLKPEEAPFHACVVGDGRIVIFNRDYNPIWRSENSAAGTAPYQLQVTDGAEFGVIDSTNSRVFSAGNTQYSGPRLLNGTLSEGNCLVSSGQIKSLDGRFTLSVGTDSIIKLEKEGKELFRSDRDNNNGPFRLCMQNDGNLVARNRADEIYWDTQSGGKGTGPYRLDLQNDGNLVVYDSTNAPLWSTDTWAWGNIQTGYQLISDTCIEGGQALISADGRFAFSLGTDASINLQHNGAFRWTASTSGKGGEGPFKMCLNSNGNLVAEGKGGQYWESATADKGKQPYRLTVQDDGNVRLYDGRNEVMWETNTVY